MLTEEQVERLTSVVETHPQVYEKGDLALAKDGWLTLKSLKTPNGLLLIVEPTLKAKTLFDERGFDNDRKKGETL